MFDMRESEERDVLEKSHWMCIESECTPPCNKDSLLQSSASDLRAAMLAFQIWAPKGWMGLIINAESTSDGLRRVANVQFAEPYGVCPWASLVKIDNLFVDELKALIDGTLSALRSESIPSRNPFQYLEIGLQTAVIMVRLARFSG